jgi:hypothetical protein
VAELACPALFLSVGVEARQRLQSADLDGLNGLQISHGFFHLDRIPEFTFNPSYACLPRMVSQCGAARLGQRVAICFLCYNFVTHLLSI